MHHRNQITNKNKSNEPKHECLVDQKKINKQNNQMGIACENKRRHDKRYFDVGPPLGTWILINLSKNVKLTWIQKRI